MIERNNMPGSMETYMDKEKKILISWNGTEEVAVVRDGVTTIAAGAFEKCQIREVRLPDSLAEIQMHAFDGCDKLQKIVFGNKRTFVESEAFIYCDGINEVIFPEDSELMNHIRCGFYIPTHKYEYAKLILENLLNDTCKIPSSLTKESVEDISKFLYDKIPVATVKFTVGKKSILIPKYNNQMSCWEFMSVIKKWLETGKAKSGLFNETGRLGVNKISPAIETYILEADKEAKKFLQKNQEMVIDYLFQCAEADNRALIGYLNLGLLSGQTLQDILHRFSDTENAEITACILEQIHKLQAGG